MQYKYNATGTQGQALSGVINAASEEEARNQLNTLGFSILEIKEVAGEEATASSDLIKFEFAAVDKNGKQIKGTIPAKTPTLAYERLRKEYGFTLTELKSENDPTPIPLAELQNAYELQKNQKPLHEAVGLEEDPAFLEEKEILLKQVDMVFQKIKALLAHYETILSPEKRADIEGNMDKLLRIKGSNNLDYIRNTCTDLLKQIQNDEIFLAQNEHQKERSEVLMESQKMMLQMTHQSAATADVGEKVLLGLEQLSERVKGTPFEPLLHPLETVTRWFETPPELTRLKAQQRALRTQRFAAYKMALKSKKEERTIALKSAQELKQQETEVNMELKALKRRTHSNKKMIDSGHAPFFLEEFNTFTGWLLGFYLAYYFLGFYVTQKGLPVKPLLGIPLDLSESVFFKYALATVFLLHAASSLKINFFLRQKAATPILFVIAGLLCFITFFNT